MKHSLPSGKPHWAITSSLREGKGVDCPKCQALHTQPCIADYATNRKMLRNEVHIERIRAMGH